MFNPNGPLLSQTTSGALASGSHSATKPAKSVPSVSLTTPTPSERRGEGDGPQDQVSLVTVSPAGVAAAEPLNWQRSFPEGLTLGELQSRALSNDPGVQRAQAMVQAAYGRAVQVGLKPNPSLGLDMQQLFSDGRAEQYGVLYEQKVVWHEKLDLNRTVVGHEIHRLTHELQVQQYRVRTDVHVAFIRALRAQRQIDVTRKLVDVNTRARELARSLLAADEVARTDLLQAQVEVSRSEMSLRDAENAHAAAWRLLETLTGQPGALSPQPLAGDFFAYPETLDYSTCLANLIAASPQRQALLAEIERARCYLRRQQVEPLPDVALGGLLNWRDNGVDGEPNAGFRFAVPLPAHDRNQGSIREARYLLVAAERRLAQLERDLAARLNPVFLEYENAQQRVQRYSNEMIPQATESLSLVSQTYEAGETSFSSLLLAQRIYAEMQLALIDSLEQLHVARAQMDGFLLSNATSISQ